MDILGIRLLGINAESGRKLALTLVFLLLALGMRSILSFLARVVLRRRHERAEFWTQQAVSLFVAGLFVIGFVSIWFDDPVRLATAAGLLTAGLAFALQKVVTAVAGYFVILRGKTFSVGDRITMGGVRGDVIALGFIQTTILEMGQPPAVQSAEPAMWVRSRQFTGRIVTVTNDKVFNEPVFNYTGDFPYIWEEISVPIAYRSDFRRAEKILLDATRREAVLLEQIGDQALGRMRARYLLHEEDVDPRVFYRMTDNWLELTARFMVDPYRSRIVKDAIAREILEEFRNADLEVASTTIDVVGLPPLRLPSRST
jgi:small-conductance mechanosensitive channel